MFFEKAPNINGSIISVTTTARNIFELVNISASTDLRYAGYSPSVNAILLQPENGDIRVTFDGTNPTATLGYLITAGTNAQFSNVPVSNMRLVSASGTVKCSVLIGKSHQGEGVVVSGTGSGGGGGGGGGGGTVNVQGQYNAVLPTLADTEEAKFQLTNRGRLLVSMDGTSFDTTVLNPVYGHRSPALQLNQVNVSANTWNNYIDTRTYSRLGVQFNLTSGTAIEHRIFGTMQEDNLIAPNLLLYQNISQHGIVPRSTNTTAALYTTSILYTIDCSMYRFINLQIVTTGVTSFSLYAITSN